MSADVFASWLSGRRRLLVITGAGCSAPSGIETYRDDEGTWRRANPIQHQDFLKNPRMRQRYWARSLAGWPVFRNALPNPAHLALAELERRGRIQCLVTQNVDGLHQQAGQQRLVELHGTLARVRCLDCAATLDRSDLQVWLEKHNPQWVDIEAAPRPDGDAEVVGRFDRFRVPECDCGGLLKPDVVFYGDSVPRSRVEQVREQLRKADGLLVVGSSLMVYSSYRFVKEARELGLPLAAINRGVTRADDWFQHKWQADSSKALPALLSAP